MGKNPPCAVLTPAFRATISRAPFTREATAAAMNVGKQEFEDVWTGRQAPSALFMANAVRSGLASHFGEIAMANPACEPPQAA